MLADVFNCQKQQIWPFRKRQGLWFPHCESFRPVSVTKIRVHSFIDAENLGRTTLHRTDIYPNLSLGGPAQLKTILCDHALIKVSARIPDIVCIAQTTLVVVHNTLLVNDRRLLFFWFDLVSDLSAYIPGADIHSKFSASFPKLPWRWIGWSLILERQHYSDRRVVYVTCSCRNWIARNFHGDKITDGQLQQLGWLLKSGERLCEAIAFQVEQLPGRWLDDY